MDKPMLYNNQIIFYQTEDGKTRIQCRFVEESLWLPQAQIAELFQVKIPTINEHLKNIYNEEELEPERTIRKFLIVQQEGNRQVKRNTDHYNLEAILAIGYRVRSKRGTQFRRWATERLHEYLVKGFTMDDERLKSPPVDNNSPPDYFDELLERIRDIRSSERRVYLRVREIFALAADYQPDLKTTTRFFKIIQNKLHYAATGKTAAELIYERASHNQANMGLASFKGKTPIKQETTVAKNYLSEAEIRELNHIVVMWLDFAEDQASRRKQVFLKDWETKLNQFLEFNERKVLGTAGKVSKKQADQKAQREYEQYRQDQRTQFENQQEANYIDELQQVAQTPKTDNR